MPPIDSNLSLLGKRIVYVSVGAFAGIWRTIKQAHSASAAGAEVSFAGYESLIPEPIVRSGKSIHAVRGLKYTTSRQPLRVLRIVSNVLLHHPRNLWVEKTSQRLFAEAVSPLCPDLVQAVDLPSLDVAARIARATGAKLVFDSSEYWQGFVGNPDVAMGSAALTVLLESETRNISACDAVFATSDEMAEQLSLDYGIARPVTIYNSPPGRVAVSRPVNSPLRLVFHGGLSRDRNLEGLIRAVKLLEGRVTLDIHGYERTQDAAALRDLIVEMELTDSVTLHGPFDYPDLVPMLAGYDVGVLTHQMADENFRYTLPNKVFDCMCAGLAVAMSDSPPMRSLVEGEGFGIVLDSATPQSIAAGLRELVDDPDRVAVMKEAAVAASARYWWPAQGEKVVEVYARILEDRA